MQVVVQDVNDPPVCTLAQPSVAVLWPPNHTMVEVSILGVTDPNNSTVTISYPRVTQDEPINGVGDGDTAPDAFKSGNNILLRAERAGSGNGRVYAVQFQVTDLGRGQAVPERSKVLRTQEHQGHRSGQRPDLQFLWPLVLSSIHRTGSQEAGPGRLVSLYRHWETRVHSHSI